MHGWLDWSIGVEGAHTGMAVPAFDGSDARGFRGLCVDVDAAVCNRCSKAGEAVEAMRVDAVASRLSEETRTLSSTVRCKAKALHGAEKSSVEIVVGNSKHESSLEASR